MRLLNLGAINVNYDFAELLEAAEIRA